MELDPEEWEAEQKRLEKEWCGLDDGYDADASQPFGDVSEEYAQRKKEQLEQKKRKRVSAKQKQIQKDNELWERNRMLTSGVVTTIDVDEDYEKVHLLVHNIVPPFLDGRYVFTKQPEDGHDVPSYFSPYPNPCKDYVDSSVKQAIQNHLVRH